MKYQGFAWHAIEYNNHLFLVIHMFSPSLWCTCRCFGPNFGFYFILFFWLCLSKWQKHICEGQLLVPLWRDRTVRCWWVLAYIILTLNSLIITKFEYILSPRQLSSMLWMSGWKWIRKAAIFHAMNKWMEMDKKRIPVSSSPRCERCLVN